MKEARIRSRLIASEENYPVHVGMCGGEVIDGFCQACERDVPRSDVVYPVPDERYRRDVAALLTRLDELEESLAEWEDGVDR